MLHPPSQLYVIHRTLPRRRTTSIIQAGHLKISSLLTRSACFLSVCMCGYEDCSIMCAAIDARQQIFSGGPVRTRRSAASRAHWKLFRMPRVAFSSHTGTCIAASQMIIFRFSTTAPDC